MTASRHDPVGDTIRALFRPESPTPTTIPRVAVLGPGDGALRHIIEQAGLVVVHERTTKRTKINFDRIPVFDLVAANIPEDPKERAEVLELAARFLWIRRPISFLFVGDSMGPDFLRATDEKLWRMGYQLSIGDARPEVWREAGIDTCTFLVGFLDGAPTLWPLKLIAEEEGNNKASNEGHDEPLDKCQRNLGKEEVDESPGLTLEDVVKRLAQYVSEDEPYFDDGLPNNQADS